MSSVPSLCLASVLEGCVEREVSGCFCKGQSPVETKRKGGENERKRPRLIRYDTTWKQAQPGHVETGNTRARVEKRKEERRPSTIVSL